MVKRAVLVNALDKVKLSVDIKGATPSNSNIYYLPEDGGSLYAFNGMLGIYSECPLGAKEFNVSAKVFLPLMKALTAEEVEMHVGKTRLALKCGGHKSKVPIDNYSPQVPGKERPSEWYDMPVGFVEALTRCVTVASKDEMQALLCGVLVSGEFVYATDGRMAIRCRVEGMEKIHALIPRQTVESIVALGQPLRYAWVDTMLWLDYGDTTVLALLWPCEKYPAAMLDDLLDESESADANTVQVPDELIYALRRSSMLGKPDDFKAVTISSIEGQLQIVGGKLYEFNEYINCQVEDGIRVTINPDFLINVLEYASEMKFGGEGDPILTYGEVVDCTCVIMPMGGHAEQAPRADDDDDNDADDDEVVPF